MGGSDQEQNLGAELKEGAEVAFLIDAARQRVLVAGQPVALRATEFRILQLLAATPNRTFARMEILESINVGDYAVSERAVDVQVVSLRKKLGSAASRIETVRGLGYRFTGPLASS
jgi:two-component system, OmpR family, alkaline phosphatase synthesis response regulator PhoP